MHTETEVLKSIAQDIASRQNPENINEPKADYRLELEANRLEKAIIRELRTIDNFTQRDTFRNDTIGKLVDICDLLYGIHHRISPDTKVLLDMLTAIKKILPSEISPLLGLPKAFISGQKEELKSAWTAYENQLKHQEIDGKLIVIAAIPFARFIDAKEKLYWGDFTWLKGYRAKLDAVDWENADCNSSTEALMSLLIGRDFNHDQYFVYCKKYITARVGKAGTRKSKLQEYDVCRKLVQEDTQDGLPAFDRHDNSLSPRLLKWIKEEIAHSVEPTENEFGKIEFSWDVDSISVFYKYMMDKGITKKINTELYAKQIAATVSSKGKEDFQWDTVHKRLYNKDEKSLNKLHDSIEAILEDVKFFLRKQG